MRAPMRGRWFVTTLVVLAFLDNEPRHGYELTQLIEQRSAGALTFNFASLYATLYKLEERRNVHRSTIAL